MSQRCRTSKWVPEARASEATNRKKRPNLEASAARGACRAAPAEHAIEMQGAVQVRVALGRCPKCIGATSSRGNTHSSEMVGNGATRATATNIGIATGRNNAEVEAVQKSACNQSLDIKRSKASRLTSSIAQTAPPSAPPHDRVDSASASPSAHRRWPAG